MSLARKRKYHCERARIEGVRNGLVRMARNAIEILVALLATPPFNTIVSLNMLYDMCSPVYLTTTRSIILHSRVVRTRLLKTTE